MEQKAAIGIYVLRKIRGPYKSALIMVPLCLFLLSSCAAMNDWLSSLNLITTPEAKSSDHANMRKENYEKKPSERGTVINRNAFDKGYIKEIQELLTNCGYHPGPTDGIMGPKTTRALRSFQLDQGLHSSGKPDAGTHSKLVSYSGKTNENKKAADKQPAPLRKPKWTVPRKTEARIENPEKRSSANSALRTGGTTVKTVGEALDALGNQNDGSFIGGQMKLAGGIYKAIGSTIENGADDMHSGKEVSFFEANKRASVATTGAIKDWMEDSKTKENKIAEAQSRLKELGFYHGKIDGVMGSATEKAIKDYQRSAGISLTGNLDDKTIQSLGI